MIYRFQPFATDKRQFGSVYNAHCAIVPDGNWIQITDYDTQILTTRIYEIIDEAIERYPDTDIFGAMTNRIAYNHQRHTKEMCENDNLKHHIRIANELARQYPNGECIEPPKERYSIAGFFFLFRKEYWNRVKFTDTIIDENGNLFDYNFCRPAKKIRIIQGAYLFHQYRLTSENWKRKDHLKISTT